MKWGEKVSNGKSRMNCVPGFLSAPASAVTSRQSSWATCQYHGIDTQKRHSIVPSYRRVWSPLKSGTVEGAATRMGRFTITKCEMAGSEKRQRIGVLVSGGGRSVENLCERIENGLLQRCDISIIIASRSKAGALQRVERFGIESRVIRPLDFDKDTEKFSSAISAVFDELNIDVIVMAGWMHFYKIPERYEGKVINIHPSLIPAFCGQGFYGSRVHEAALSFGVKISGCTVHIADNKYDHGPIILQKTVQVFDSDSADDLAARVFEKEKEALPEAVQLFVDGRVQISDNGVVQVLSESQAVIKQ